jgi:hypothetical protein
MTEINELTAEYYETDTERVIEFARGKQRVQIAQNRDGYAMLKVCEAGDELERYYGFEMALDHAAELLGVSPNDLPVPEAGSDMGM